MPIILRGFHQAVLCSINHARDIAVNLKDIQILFKVSEMENVESSTSCTMDSPVSFDRETLENIKDENLSVPVKCTAEGPFIKGDQLHLKDPDNCHDVMGNTHFQRPESTLSSNSVMDFLHPLGQKLPSDGHDDDDDVSWFFEDDKVTHMNVFNRPEQELTSTSIEKSYHFRLNIKHDNDYNSLGKSQHFPVRQEVSDSKSDITTRQDCVDDDEFDWCFDDEPTLESHSDHKHEGANVTKYIPPVNDGVFDTSRICDDGGEDGSCFKDRNSSSISGNVLAVNSSKIQEDASIMCPKHTKHVNDLTFNETGSQTTRTIGECAVDLLEKRLQEVLKNRSMEALKTKVLNRCRHFTTVESTVSELQETQNHEHESSELGTNKMNSRDAETGMKVNSTLMGKGSSETNDLSLSPATRQVSYSFSSTRKQFVGSAELFKPETSLHLKQNDIPKQHCCHGFNYSRKNMLSYRGSSLSSLNNAQDGAHVVNMERNDKYSLLLKLVKLLCHGAEEIVQFVADVCWKQMKEKGGSLFSR